MLKFFKCCTLFFLLLYYLPVAAQKQTAGNDRQLWLRYLDRVARPVMRHLAEDELKEKMPVTLSRNIDNKEHRSRVAYLEAFGRTLSGIAPWLNGEGGSPEEAALRKQYRQWTLKGLANAVNPAAKDYMLWTGGQPLVDASFLALGLVRCPWLWNALDTTAQKRVVQAFLTTRATVPVYSNWILFSAMVEAFFCKYALPYDPVRIEYAIREFGQHWYVGDGLFSDGMKYAQDYYNSYVIQPYLVAILEVMRQKNARAYDWFAPKMEAIAKRYADIQERLIATDGSFPVTGRSITYRGGAFHHLADAALRNRLPEGMHPAAVRGGLTAVIRRTLEPDATFTADGWLNIGLHGHQPDLAERYITTGSLYLCANIFLPLGLPETDAFWSAPARPWTAVKAWSGQDLPADHALE